MKILTSLIAVLMFAGFGDAAVKVNPVFTDNMMLQRHMEAPVWGTADPGEMVTVEYVPNEYSAHLPCKVTVKTGTGGKWIARLKTMRESEKPAIIKVSGSSAPDNVIQFKNVIVGDVWLGSGQSNMAGSCKHYTKNDPALTAAYDGAPYPNMRIFQDGKWQPATTNIIINSSALMFSFAHKLHNELKVPVGFIVGAVGGTPSGRWLTEEMALDDPLFMKMFKEETGHKTFAEWYATEDQLKKAHEEKVAKAKEKGWHPPRYKGMIRLGNLYKLHVEPMVPYGIKGVLWDQGESRTQVEGVDQYTVMHALVKGWRKAWDQGDFPFLHVQKPSGGGCAWDPANPVNAKAMAAEELPEYNRTMKYHIEMNLNHIRMGTLLNAPLITASDLAPGIHPPTKYAYGQRACRVALGEVYEKKGVQAFGPVYKSHKIRFTEVEVTFDNIGSGLAFKHAANLQGFELAGKDHKWHWADAKIFGRTVRVSSAQVPKPFYVRYAYNKKFTYANLFNKDGLPALMFTTSARE